MRVQAALKYVNLNIVNNKATVLHCLNNTSSIVDNLK